MAPVAIVTDSTSYLTPELIQRHGVTVVPLYVVFGGDRTVPETDITDYPAFFEELRGIDKLPTTSQPSVGDFVAAFEPLLAAGPRRRLDPHLGRALGHRRVGAPGRRGAGARRQGRRARARHGLEDRRRRPRPHRDRGRHRRERRSERRRGARASPRGARRAEDVVRARHARVPKPRRAHRRGERLDRLDAAGQADPHRRDGDGSRRARAHERPHVRADGRLRAPAPRLGRRRLVRPAHQRAGPVRATGGALPRPLRLPADARQRDRPRAEHPHRPGPARRRRRTRCASCSSAPGAWPAGPSGAVATIAPCARLPPSRCSGSC